MADCGINCQEALKDLERFLDGEVDTPIEVQIQLHLSDCHPCMERAEFRKHVKSLVHEKCAEQDVPADLRARLIARLESFDVPS
jgi:mycothiol system anti-sigma-R factor